jgi:hypothetical protein
MLDKLQSGWYFLNMYAKIPTKEKINHELLYTCYPAGT